METARDVFMDLLDCGSLADWRVTATAICLLVAGLSYLVFRADPERAIDFSVPAPKPGKTGLQATQQSIKVPGSTAIYCYAPATGEPLGLINPSTADGIDRIIAKASAAQLQWRLTTFSQRRRVLKTILKFILDYQEDIVRAACLDSGKTRVDAIFGEILVTVEKLQWTIQHGERALRPERRPTNFLMFYKRNEVHYEPLGVVAACVSWNYPFHNLLGPVISGLFAGNAVVIKNSEQTAWSSVYFANIARAALSACDHSSDLVHAISCWPATADYFTSHRGIRHLTFIGSRPVAHEVAKSASKQLTPLCVELGGKDAAIVLDAPNGRASAKAEMDRVTSIIMRGVFQSAGQNCIGIERVIAMPVAYDELVERLRPRVKALRLGNDLNPDEMVDVGALISPASLDRLERLVAEAEAQGARLLAGGQRFHHVDYPNGHYFTPTLLVDVTPEMRIAQEELFAPLCLLMRAPTIDEAVNMANGTEYGLGCSVFGPTTSSKARDNLKHVTQQVNSGMVAVNDFAAYYMVQLPFGGSRGSGYGRFAGEEGLRSLCNIKSVCSDRSKLIKTAIPAALDYPMGGTAWHVAAGVVEVGYGESLTRRLRGILKLTGFQGA